MSRRFKISGGGGGEGGGGDTGHEWEKLSSANQQPSRSIEVWRPTAEISDFNSSELCISISSKKTSHM